MTIEIRDGDNTEKHLKASGAGTSGDPFIPEHTVSGNVAITAASLPLPTGAATAAKQPALGTAGTASTDVITVQGIASGTVIPVSDGGGSLTVDGTVTANLGTLNGAATTAKQDTIIGHVDGIEALLGTIDADTSALAGAVSGSEMQVDVLTLPAVTNAGTFATQVTGDALTALQTIDNIVSGSGANISQINGVTPLMGAGNTGTGSPRVTIASDQAAIPVTAAGSVASGATDSGNPVKIGGKYNSSGATSTDGQRGDLQLDARANAKLTLFDVVEVTGSLTVSTSAYAIGDAVGGKITFSSASLVSAGWCRITGIAVTDQDKDMPSCVLTLFTADPSGTTVTDNAALDIADADMGKIVKAQSIVDWVGYSDNAICTPSNVDIMCKVASGTSLYGCFHTLQAFTPAATTDWSVKLTIERYL